MKKEELDYVLVPSGLLILAIYHVWLLYRVINHPTKTVIGINSINRQIWVRTMMEDPAKTGILAVQTLRNNIMASTLLASTAIMLSSLIAVLTTNGYGNHGNGGGNQVNGLVYGDTSNLGFSIKVFAILVCFLVSFLLNVQSIRYYSHAGILINVPVHKNSNRTPFVSAEYVGKAVNRASYFWSLGLRALYFSLPLFFWLFGPIPMFVSCCFLVFLLFFLDVSFMWETYDIHREEKEATDLEPC